MRSFIAAAALLLATVNSSSAYTVDIGGW